MKPVNGGSPPRDSRRRGAIEVSVGNFVEERANILMVVVLLTLNIVKVAIVIRR